MGRPPLVNEGKPALARGACFPSFFSSRKGQRVLTADAWAFLSSENQKRLQGRALQDAQAYVQQAQEFFKSADNPRIASRPLLYYYSYLNLVKVLLLHKGIVVPPTAKHGLDEAALNVNVDLDLARQRIRLWRSQTGPVWNAAGHFAKALGGPDKEIFTVQEVLGWLPSIHRTWTQSFVKSNAFCPVAISVVQEGDRYRTRILIDPNDEDVKQTLPKLRKKPEFKTMLTQVRVDWQKQRPPSGGTRIFETGYRIGKTRWVDRAIRRLRDDLEEVGVYHILKPTGYSYYLAAHGNAPRLNQLLSSYMAMYYFGSLTRYRPVDYATVQNRYNWLVGDFLETEPVQFLYGISSLVAGNDVTMGQAVRRASLT